MTPWQELDAELARWERPATLWWRDDDAVAPGPALDRLLELAAETPMALAVIPALAEPALERRLADTAGVAVLQHGYAHRDHAPPGSRKIELGGRPEAVVLDEVVRGRDRLADLFGARALPVLVPPWNRIDDAVGDRLAEFGVRALSGLGPRSSARHRGLALANVHVDLIDWRGGRAFAGEAAVLGRLTEHLRARRTGEVDPAEPTGLMTHHLDHDEACWTFLEALLLHLETRPVRWLCAPEVFGLSLDSPAAVR